MIEFYSNIKMYKIFVTKFSKNQLTLLWFLLLLILEFLLTTGLHSNVWVSKDDDHMFVTHSCSALLNNSFRP